METTSTISSLDRRGLSITTAVVYDLALALETMAEGDVVEVITDDFAPFEADIGAWCHATGHVLVDSEPAGVTRRFLVEKRSPKVKDTSLAMVISSASLEELLSPLGFALAAALEGTQVHVYFQGPAVRLLTRGFRPKLRGLARPFSRFASAAMARTGHLPAQEKLRQLHHLGARFYVCGGSLDHFKVSPDDFVFDDLPLVEYLTFMPVMEDATVQLYV